MKIFKIIKTLYLKIRYRKMYKNFKGKDYIY